MLARTPEGRQQPNGEGWLLNTDCFCLGRRKVRRNRQLAPVLRVFQAHNPGVSPSPLPSFS